MKLRIERGLGAGQEFELTELLTTLGRARENHIVLPDPTISRYHARVDRQGNAFILSDLNSLSGTWLNGRRLTAPQWLREGDTIVLGGTTLIALPSAQVPTFSSTVPTQVFITPEPRGPAQQQSSTAVVMIALGIVGVIVILIVTFALVLVLQTGGPASLAMVVPTATLTTSPSQTPTTLPAATRMPLPTSTPLPTVTATRTPTLTPSPLPTATAPPRRLSNGTFIKQTASLTGDGELEINNGQDLDAVVVLTMLNDASLFAVYVRARDQFKIEGISDGTYKLFFMLGEDWDSVTGRFTRKARYQVFEDTFRYTTTSTTATIWRITLHPVAGGTGRTDSVSPQNFPSVK